MQESCRTPVDLFRPSTPYFGVMAWMHATSAGMSLECHLHKLWHPHPLHLPSVLPCVIVAAGAFRRAVMFSCRFRPVRIPIQRVAERRNSQARIAAPIGPPYGKTFPVCETGFAGP